MAHELFGVIHAQGDEIFPRPDPHVLFKIPRKIFAVHIKPFGYFGNVQALLKIVLYENNDVVDPAFAVCMGVLLVYIQLLKKQKADRYDRAFYDVRAIRIGVLALLDENFAKLFDLTQLSFVEIHDHVF